MRCYSNFRSQQKPRDKGKEHIHQLHPLSIYRNLYSLHSDVELGLAVLIVDCKMHLI